MLTLMIMMVLLLFSIIWIGMKLAWGVTKLALGLGLFWFCPLLYVLAVMFGWFGFMWLPILIVGLLLGGGFRRII